ncbi:MAG: DUF4178 domain-containing protein [Bryobacteraceae bacterium]|nr:DUF4178 domain-containing protein [Bryobacteraceae bacterium]
MITTAVLLILGGLLAAILWQMFKGGAGSTAEGRSKAPSGLAPPPAPIGANVDLQQAKPGDSISIPGAADDFSDVDFTVDRRSAYESLNRRWTDLSGEWRGSRVYLEVHPGVDPEVMAIVSPRKFTLPDLGISEDDLKDMDARQDPTTFVTFEGKQFLFEASREVGYFENETGEGEGLYRWLFHETGSNRLISIEKWEGEPFDVRLAQRLNPRDITVFRAA